MQPTLVQRELATVVTNEECAAIVARIADMGFRATAGDYPPTYRDNDRAVRDDPELAAWLFARIRHQLPRELPGPRGLVRLTRLNPRFRFCRYQGGQCFRIHRDGAYAPAPGERSILTCQVSLSAPNDFEGGRTRFYESRRGPETHAFRPARGSALLFRHDAWHDGEAVTRGTKIVMRTDVLYEGDFGPQSGRSRAPQGYVFAACVLSDGRIALGSRDRMVHLIGEGSVALAGHVASVTALCEPRAGVLVSASRDRSVIVRDLRSGAIGHRVTAHDGAVLALTSCGNGEVLSGGADGCVVAHDIVTGRVTQRVRMHEGWVWGLGISPDGQWLASAGDDGALCIWAPGRMVERFHHELRRGPIHAIAFVDDRTVAVGLADGWVHVLRIDEDTVHPVFAFPAHDGELYGLVTLDDGFVTCGEDGAAHRFDRSGRRVSAITRTDFVRAIVPLGHDRFVVAGYDGVTIAELSGPQCEKRSPSDATLASCSRSPDVAAPFVASLREEAPT